MTWKAVAFTSILLAGACTRRLSKPACLDVLARDNSHTTAALFASRKCQGGGVTWSAILQAVLARKGAVAVDIQPPAHWTGDVQTLNRDVRFSIDDSSDVARFCSDDAALLATVKRDVERLNNDSRALEGMMAAADPLALECLGRDGKSPPLPENIQHLLAIAASPSPKEAMNSCRTNPALTGPCFEIKGRAFAANGTPSLRIAPYDSRRVFGVQFAEHEIAPTCFRENVTFELDLVGRFTVCPLSVERPNTMRSVCVEDVHDAVVLPVAAAREKGRGRKIDDCHLERPHAP